MSHSQYYVGDGSVDNAMLHIQIAFMLGRSDELKKEMGELITQYLQNHLTMLVPEIENKLNLQITVHFQDVLKNSYFKYPSGTI